MPDVDANGRAPVGKLLQRRAPFGTHSPETGETIHYDAGPVHLAPVSAVGWAPICGIPLAPATAFTKPSTVPPGTLCAACRAA